MKLLHKLALLMALALPAALIACGGDSGSSETRPFEVSYTVKTGNTQNYSASELGTYITVINLYQHSVDSVNGSHTVILTDKSENDAKVKAACYNVEYRLKTDYPDFRGLVYVVNDASSREVYRYNKP